MAQACLCSLGIELYTVQAGSTLYDKNEKGQLEFFSKLKLSRKREKISAI
jgi:hypothetical protein